MRYFALLYTPDSQREMASALFVIDAEIRESAQSANHDVAHTRLQWWRHEIDRLINRNAQHPAARVLSGASIDRRQFGKLHELIAAADMDLARMTYLDEREVRAYCARSGGAVTELLAILLMPDDAIDTATRALANRIGAFVRAAETIRDLRQDAYDGRLYVPLDAVEKHGLKHEDLKSPSLSAAGRTALRELAAAHRADFEATLAAIPAPTRAYLRPLCVLGELHAALLESIAQRDFDVGAERIDLSPFRKTWVAWRAARRAK